MPVGVRISAVVSLFTLASLFPGYHHPHPLFMALSIAFLFCFMLINVRTHVAHLDLTFSIRKTMHIAVANLRRQVKELRGREADFLL